MVAGKREENKEKLWNYTTGFEEMGSCRILKSRKVICVILQFGGLSGSFNFPFFRMESAYRAWVRERREGVAHQDLDELYRELKTALGTAKWQVGY